MMCSGAWATTLPWVSKPLRPARPAICLKSRTESIATFWPSNLASWVKSTVRIGMLTPTPSVSVPQITLSSALLRELLDEQPVLGQEAGVVDADAEGEEAAELLAVGSVEAEAAHGVADPLALLAAWRSCMLVSDWASSAHSRWVKLTM